MKGNYLYGVVPLGNEVRHHREDMNPAEDLGPIGIDGATVKTVPYGKLAAVVHGCDIDMKIPDDEKGAGRWIIAHQGVVEKVWGRFAVIVPSSFGTIIKGDDPDKTTAEWLAGNYESFLTELKNLVGKAEYGVQIFWDLKQVSGEVVSGDHELLTLQDRIRSASQGTAYLHKKKMEQILRERLEEKALHFFKETYDTIHGIVEDIVIERLKPAREGSQMVMNVSCLMPRKDEKTLGAFLDEINGAGGCSVRFTGPWAPYSFVNKTAEGRKNERRWSP